MQRAAEKDCLGSDRNRGSAPLYIPAITYHQVLCDETPVRVRKPGEGLHSGQIHLSEFVRQMDYLTDQGFSPITPDQLHAWLTAGGALPAKPIVIDFDDHSMISYKNALPVMRERGLSATMFVISGLADGDPTLDAEWWSVARMRWRELEHLVDAGWSIGAHTRNHLFLNTVPDGPEGDERIMYELVQCNDDIEANLGIRPRHFAYPNGLWNDRAEELVKQVYDLARHFQCFGHAHYVTKGTDPFRLPTMNINYLLPFEEFKALVDHTDPDHDYYPGSRVIGGPPPPE